MEFIMSYNLCLLMFVSYTVIISISGFMIFMAKSIPVPDAFLQAFKFGKMAHDSKPWRIISLLEVPKRYFLHFYISASVLVSIVILQVWTVYANGESLSPWMSQALDILTSPDREPIVSTTSAAISIVLFALHIYRRLYENLFVSVFSSSHMNIMHYIVGHTHYWGAMMLLIAHFPAFSSSDSKTTFSPLEFCHIIGMFLYLYGFIVQHQSLRILAGLRSDRGKDAQKHKMPVGGMFEVVSCPHMMAEVLVYVGILFVLQKHTGWLAVTVWVICNQIQVALMNHKWYQETFKDYPRNRKAIFPGVL